MAAKKLALVRSVDDALETILKSFESLPTRTVSIQDALGMVTAEPICSERDLPSFSNSAMDGFALVAGSTGHATRTNPVTLQVIGDAPVGRMCPTTVVSGTAVKIMTGPPLPDGADAVIQFEEIKALSPNGSHRRLIAVSRPVHLSENIRPAGEDVVNGVTVIAPGTVIRPAEVGMIASLGKASVVVHQRPRVAVLATGDELVNPGGALGPGQIFNSNSPMISALVTRTGGIPVTLAIARDLSEELTAILREIDEVDLILTTGGVSVGDYDLVKQVLQREGTIVSWQVRMKPGKPLAFGHLAGTPLIGLPGNPVAAAVAFELFARPAIKCMLGYGDPLVPSIQTQLLSRIENRGRRRNYVRAKTWWNGGGYVSECDSKQGSAIMSSLIRGNSLVVIPEDCQIAEPGSFFEAKMLEWDNPT